MERNFSNCNVTVKNAEDGEVILKTTVVRQMRDNRIVVLRCTENIFRTVKRVDLVISGGGRVYYCAGTVRRIDLIDSEAEVALYSIKNVNNRMHQRYSVHAPIKIMRHSTADGQLLGLASFSALLLDLSVAGVRIRCDERKLGQGDIVAFAIVNSPITQTLYAKVLYTVYDSFGRPQYGCELLHEDDARLGPRKKTGPDIIKR